MKMGRRLRDVSEASSLCPLGKKQSEDASPTPLCRRPILIVSNFSLFEPQTFRDEDAVQSVEEELHQQCE